jgi:hypothetical protein
MYEDSIIKPTTHYLKRMRREKTVWEYNRMGELVQSTPYTFMEVSQ